MDGDDRIQHEPGVAVLLVEPVEVLLPGSVEAAHPRRRAPLELDELELNRVFEEFKALADKKKELFDGDIEALVLRAEGGAHGPWSLSSLDIAGEHGKPFTAKVRLQHVDGRIVERSAIGDGPVDATYKAVEQATGVAVNVRKFEVHAVTIGEDAQGEAVVYAEQEGRSYRGSSISTNIIEASAKALLEIVNRVEQLASSHARTGVERRNTASAQASV